MPKLKFLVQLAFQAASAEQSPDTSSGDATPPHLFRGGEDPINERGHPLPVLGFDAELFATRRRQ